MKTSFIVLIIIISVIFVVIISTSSPETERVDGRPVPDREKISKQLEDVNKKIAELPELENDVFSKCMETTDGTADDIKDCQESTQKQIFTLSQDLNNLKKSLEEKK